ncbi:MAG: hypothetical protein NTU43_07200 [Bacteroidetes bacterium]|nr:hypothetical protein [Bacteroidota bacterium]
MKERIMTGWTYTRGLYLLMGLVIIVQAFMAKQWMGVAFGGYFASMGLFAFGCASGSCFGATRNANVSQKPLDDTIDVDYEEVKTK